MKRSTGDCSAQKSTSYYPQMNTWDFWLLWGRDLDRATARLPRQKLQCLTRKLIYARQEIQLHAVRWTQHKSHRNPGKSFWWLPGILEWAIYHLRTIANKNFAYNLLQFGRKCAFMRFSEVLLPFIFPLFPCIKLMQHAKECRRVERLNMSFKTVTQELKLNKCRQNRKVGKNSMNREGKHKNKSTDSLYHDFNGHLAFVVEMAAEPRLSFLHCI